MTAPWLVLGGSDHRIPSRSRLWLDFAFLLAPPVFDNHVAGALKPAKEMGEGSGNTTNVREPKKDDGRKPTGTRRAKKEQPIKQVKARSRSRARKADGTSQIIGKVITFTLEAPGASEVFLAGSFNGWDRRATPLKQNQQGAWACVVSVEPGEHQYRFVVDGEWRGDPLNPHTCRNGLGTENCVLIVE
ncbi:MAG TPA: hypothetical protein DCR97_01095 [Deltaproteobacteria bacterium]|nr:hypothetical protein [Deltaproteobacteria bacterium]